MIRDKKIRMKATAASCLVKFTEKYEAGAHADIFGNATFSHTGRRRGDKQLVFCANTSRATFPDGKILDFKPYELVCQRVSICMSLYFTLAQPYVLVCIRMLLVCHSQYPCGVQVMTVFFFCGAKRSWMCTHTCSAFEYACLYADFCNFTVTTTRRKSPPLVALIALINVHFFPSLFFSLAFSENTLAYKERVIRIHFDRRISLVCLSRRGTYASNQIAGILNCYDHDQDHQEITSVDANLFNQLRFLSCRFRVSTNFRKIFQQ